MSDSRVIVCLDVDYRDLGAVAAGLWFEHWQDDTSSAEAVLAIEQVAPYQSGELCRRELPCLLSVLAQGPPAEIVIVDGYVWLDDELRPGLGAHLGLSVRRSPSSAWRRRGSTARHSQWSCGAGPAALPSM